MEFKNFFCLSYNVDSTDYNQFDSPPNNPLDSVSSHASNSWDINSVHSAAVVERAKRLANMSGHLGKS